MESLWTINDYNDIYIQRYIDMIYIYIDNDNDIQIYVFQQLDMIIDIWVCLFRYTVYAQNFYAKGT